MRYPDRNLMKPKITDLTKRFPRSPREKLGGYVHLARMIDKAHAKAAGRLGEYIYPCPLDELLLQFLELSGDGFYDTAKTNHDQGVLEWLKQNTRERSPTAIETWNKTFLYRKPDNKESMRRFIDTRNRIAPKRTDITRWVDLLDLDEGREVPSNPPD